MILWLGVVAIATLVAEILTIRWVAEQITVPNTLLLLILCSAGGAWIVKREGMAAWHRLQAATRDGRIPTGEIVDGAMILLAGALLLPPGFLTSAVGLLLIIPPVRRLAGRLVADTIRVRIARRIPAVDLRMGGERPRPPDPRTRVYRRPGEGPGAAPRDVIDVDGEEVDLFEGPVELGPPPRD